MAVLVSTLINEVITELSMTAGVSTQIYASPHIQQHIQDAILFIIEEMWWPDLMDYYPVTLDGVSGQITSDLTTGLLNHEISRFQDIQHVFVEGTNKKLRAPPPGFNPFTLSGSGPLYIASSMANAARPFFVWPKTSAGNLVVRARAHPKLPIGTDDTLYLDRLLLTFYAAYSYANDDGTNPGQIDGFMKKFEKRMTQVKTSWGHQALDLDPRFPQTEFQWSERE